MEKTKEKFFTKGIVVLIFGLISCFLWGSAFPSIKIGYKMFQISSSNTSGKILFAGYRFLISSSMIALFCLLSGYSLKISKSNLWKLTMLGFLQTTTQYVFFYIGMSHTTGTKGSILAATNTFFGVVIAHFFYKEDRMSIKRILGIILGFLGVVIVSVKGGGIDGGFTLIGEGFVVLSSLAGALAGIYIKKLAKEISPFAISCYQLFTGSIVLMLIGFAGGQRGLYFTPKGSILLIYMGFISAAAFSLWSILLKYNSVGKVFIYKATVPIFGVMLSYIFLHEEFIGLNVIAAVILVSLGIMLINKD